MINPLREAIAVMVLITVTGCSPAPYVIVEPEKAAALNSPDWTVKHEPTKPSSGERANQ